jgi:hypothetical protein
LLAIYIMLPNMLGYVHLVELAGLRDYGCWICPLEVSMELEGLNLCLQHAIKTQIWWLDL